jgi:pimeloyl-ACP methyl ester carboxylesterase
MTFQWQPGEARSIEVDGVGLEAVCYGPAPSGERPTIVMLHEGLGCAMMWRKLPATLAEHTGCGVFAYSRAGYGGSDPCPLPRPLDYMTREAVDVLPDVLDAIGARRVILLGHSDGATIAAIHAGSVPGSRVRGLILIAPHFFNEDVSVRSIAAAREAFETGDLRERLARYHGDNVDVAFRGWNDVWLAPGFRDWDVSDVIPYIRVPILVIQGEDDQYGTRAQVDVVTERTNAPVEIVMVAARHHPQFEAAEATLAAIEDFVARLLRIENAGRVAA